MSARHAIDGFAEPITHQHLLGEQVAGRDSGTGSEGSPKGPGGSAAALGSQHQRPRVVPGIGQLGRAVGGADLHRCEPISPMCRLHLTAH